MRRGQLISLLAVPLVIAIGCGWLIHIENDHRAAHQRELGYQGKLRSYAADYPAGTTRQQVEESLRTRGVAFFGFPAFGEDSAYADLVTIGEEKGGPGCGPGSVNIAIRFQTGTNHRAGADPADSVSRLDLFKLFQNCM
jgi:hypothetical protein